jgi:tetratricopeptide (TPR) repeat protein
MQLAEESLERCREAHQLQGAALCLAWRGTVKLTVNRLDDAMDDALESLRLVRQLGAREDEVLALCLKVRVHFARGDARDALNAVQELLPLMEHHDHEGIAAQVTAWHARALASVRRRPAASAVLQSRRPSPDAWPHIKIRSHIALGRALRVLKRSDEAREHFAQALTTAESAGFRYFQLLAHNELVFVEPDESARARHDRVARAMARSLAANLPKDQAASFMARGWGQTEADSR